MYTKIFRAVIIGAPGSGKGTISERIVKTFGFLHISSGDILRQNIINNTELGKKAQRYIADGQLVPDDIVTKTMLARITEVGNKSYILDGFPRNSAQADILSAREQIDAVIDLNIPHDVIIERLKNRWIHVPSGRVYNIGFNDPKVSGVDDVTGEPLTQREDDKPDVVAKRLQLFDELMNPVLAWYAQRGLVTTFKGRETKEIWPRVERFLKDKVNKG
ncbi:GTP:AMP phosphotransferase AK3, mitochondrial [Drosophila innubila]|uniref:GTP:AMP phosphotransferase AK3, mitochondrial n=1 Tax=Drosophila innubila TaxID=198719 RepID=UPI00148E311A|nr:GTP:AMP phosphotransferase AK3, mitochondrial [Drosophila innubila]XP_034488522.1 GTP:AMP phosphotransferase AK3, mitochondrial [Drosophila innubila]XP_034488523.1 GTP:AMP phosphotransferase AK3, mitochondrial [Drosophila innubila]XP_034488524.1 GTP:AMP phosphotransferase AK3, mitochondrial [Drosophila innubila]